MSKSWRKSGGGANPSTRRYSQPVFVGPSAADRNRRGSEMAHPSRANDTLSQPSVSQTSQYEEKFSLDKSSRKSRGIKDGTDGASFDPDHYNPDGSLRTMHRMPNFNDAYEEAKKAYYIRPTTLRERERELSVKEIFEDS